MKASIILVVAAALVGDAAARNCKTGLYYCGSTLTGIGNYRPQLDQLSFDTKHGIQYPSKWKTSLFYCHGGREGVISWKRDCPIGCVDGGANKNDYCTPCKFRFRPCFRRPELTIQTARFVRKEAEAEAEPEFEGEIEAPEVAIAE